MVFMYFSNFILKRVNLWSKQHIQNYGQKYIQNNGLYRAAQQDEASFRHNFVSVKSGLFVATRSANMPVRTRWRENNLDSTYKRLFATNNGQSRFGSSWNELALRLIKLIYSVRRVFFAEIVHFSIALPPARLYNSPWLRSVRHNFVSVKSGLFVEVYPM